jgi:hypothetical protein
VAAAAAALLPANLEKTREKGARSLCRPRASLLALAVRWFLRNLLVFMILVVPASFASLGLAEGFASVFGGSVNASALGTLELVLFFWAFLLPVNLALVAVHSLILVSLEGFRGGALKRWAWLLSVAVFPLIVFMISLIAYGGSLEPAVDILFLSTLFLPFMLVYSKFAASPYGTSQHLSWRAKLTRFVVYGCIAVILTVLLALAFFSLASS